MSEHAACADRKIRTHYGDTCPLHLEAVLSHNAQGGGVCVCVCLTILNIHLDDLENRKKKIIEQRQVFNDQ